MGHQLVITLIVLPKIQGIERVKVAAFNQVSDGAVMRAAYYSSEAAGIDGIKL